MTIRDAGHLTDPFGHKAGPPHSDAYLRSNAASVRHYGHPAILSFGAEMNGSWYSRDPGTRGRMYS
ncbi:MAG: hypothetical protein ACRDS0_01865 [Pseudonocardiaceae bacterium]